LKGLVVFGEHRFFGESWPFPNKKDLLKDNTVNRYLTVEQAMMDYVKLIKYIRYKYNAMQQPCIVFGGSYGGMLAAWLRMKFPATFQGALSSSAPLLYFKDSPTAPPAGFGEVIT
jgi:lysosomal Pro-X carboxypeptidase